mmetsp:Transcript_7765/g.22517  ORF Transcript_7765/g.22517 Transcript_7765/m.22517 type:complete len:421 (+) Transcript_7765:303-1565(+)|eukprot:CAMPEP_0119563180 /NCGR_PEP_ID=MMETSP1352-20130426/22650_1 /TAXON_ID=265584 /ORGANISM="Stauroneis constricta, Strain CCMP1120" /LENGTH=420 /DNA_ID=CAMNT_0007611727 /DNA_START=235 /DNA_END=1497 /DNA_ORIENTATION=+
MLTSAEATTTTMARSKSKRSSGGDVTKRDTASEGSKQRQRKHHRAAAAEATGSQPSLPPSEHRHPSPTVRRRKTTKGKSNAGETAATARKRKTKKMKCGKAPAAGGNDEKGVTMAAENSSSHTHSSTITPTATATGTSAQRTISISFAASDEIRTIEPLDSFTESAQLWYQEDEYELIHKKVLKLIHKMNEGTADAYCTRGLERLVGQRLETSRTSRRAAYDAVAKVQHEEWMMRHYGIGRPLDDDDDTGDGNALSSDERIAEAYLKISRLSQVRAVSIGAHDAEIVSSYLMKKPKQASSKKKSKKQRQHQSKKTKKQTQQPAGGGSSHATNTGGGDGTVVDPSMYQPPNSFTSLSSDLDESIHSIGGEHPLPSYTSASHHNNAGRNNHPPSILSTTTATQTSRSTNSVAVTPLIVARCA